MRRLSVFALLAAFASGCDFTPTLDVPLPEFEPALAVSGVLAADSTVEVRVTAALDPYGLYELRNGDGFETPKAATVELFRDGASVGALRLISERCVNYTRPPEPGGEPETYECGAFVSDHVVQPGALYTLRAEAPGYPPVSATVRVPQRVPVTGTVRPLAPEADGRAAWDASVTLRDPAGTGDRYALLAVTGPYSYSDTYSVCQRGSCRDTTVTYAVPRFQLDYTTSDPVLLGGARTNPANGSTFVTFGDETFDGRGRTFGVTVRGFGTPEFNPLLEEVWLVALGGETFDAYQIAWFGYPLGDDPNPFQEPLNLPSNVEGGYGLLGAVTIHAVPAE